MINAVILAGGSGSRLWPLSLPTRPKQFLALNGKDTMFQATVKRLSDLEIGLIMTICNEQYRFLVAEQLLEMDKLGSIILEPIGRNTAPAIAISALLLKDDPLLLVLAADHVIEDQVAFNKAIYKATELAELGKLVTFGIVPNEPHTGYGYIKRGVLEGPGYAVDEFVEKPSIKTAESYIRSGRYYWNSGMFLFRASRYLEELNKFRPDIYKACVSAISGAQADSDFLRINKSKFESCPSESVDYAVMEKTNDAMVVPMDAGWSDIGSWSSLWDISEKDAKGNVIKGNVISHGCNNSYIMSDNKLVAAIGLNDLIVVSTKETIMVSHKDSVQDIKAVVEKLKDHKN